jgi:hypothetical protein
MECKWNAGCRFGVDYRGVAAVEAVKLQAALRCGATNGTMAFYFGPMDTAPVMSNSFCLV